MKRIFTLAIFAFVLSFNANAQLADGSVAPDFTVTDINGNEINLYSILDDGKTVIMDISATWCGPCWGYHETHALKETWEMYGPDGTNEMYVIFVEGDPNTTLDDLNGTGNNTQGNWVEGTPYPMVDGADGASIASSYAISFFPTIYAICPSRKVTEVGQSTPAQLYATVASCPAAQGVNNGGLLSYNGLSGSFCGSSTFSPSVTFQNLGEADITNAIVSLSLNGNVVETLNIEDTLSTYSTTELTFSSIDVDTATELEINIVSINGGDDEVNDHNTISASLSPTTTIVNTQSVTVNVTTDNYGYETYWVVRDADGIIYAEGGLAQIGASGGGQRVITSAEAPNGLANNTEFSETVELPANGCYEFAIYDDYGDGMCCNYGEGSFALLDANGNTIIEGAEYTNNVITPFLLDAEISNVDNVAGLTGLNVSPNPVSNLAKVTFGLENATNIKATVYNVVGERVATINQNFTVGANEFIINASNYANGVYFVNLSSDKGTSTVKFTVAK